MDCGNLVCIRGGGTKEVLWRYYINGRSEMQGGKNSILPKKQTGSSGTLMLEIWKTLISLYRTEWRDRGNGLRV
jgi:hypothetical protein